jgi:hypothetical protein
MKRIPFAFFLFVLLTSAACSFDLLSTVRGSGDIQSQSFDVRGFDQVELATIGEVYIEQGDSESLTIETDDNILPLLAVKVKNGKLTLSTKDRVNLRPSGTITYRLTVKTLTTIVADSSGDLAAGPLAGERLEVLSNASGDVSLESVQVDELVITSRGSGDVTVNETETGSVLAQLTSSGDVKIAGKTTSLRIQSEGSGDLFAGDLQASGVEAELQSSGNATIWAVDKLDMAVDGSGDVAYYGSPRMTSSLGGSGDLRSLGEK